MENENTKNKNERFFIENFSSVIAGITTLFFALSVLYNHIYFLLLGVDIGVIPLTITDYVLTFKEYSFFLIVVVFPFFSNIKNAYYNYFDKRMVTPSDRGLKSKEKVILVFLCITSLLPLWSICDAAINKNIFLVQPQILLILFIPVVTYVVLFVTLSRKKSTYFFLILFFIFLVLQLWHISKENIISSFINKTYIENMHPKQLVLRTFEKGMLISTGNDNLSFRYLGSKEVINFKRNEQLVEYFEKFHNIKMITPNLAKDEKNSVE